MGICWGFYSNWWGSNSHGDVQETVAVNRDHRNCHIIYRPIYPRKKCWSSFSRRWHRRLMAKPLNNDETQFIVGISEGTGVDPRVVAAWVYQEGAFRSGGTGGHNYLNVKPAPGDNH